MNEITRITLENEMDLILAHKQSMRFAELTGLSLAAQTTFATAVSELCRTVTTEDGSSSLTIYISDKADTIKYLTAILRDARKDNKDQKEAGIKYARRLVPDIYIKQTGKYSETSLKFRLPHGLRVDDTMLEKWRINMNTDPALSPYEEIKRKNRQLMDLAEKVKESEQQYKSLTDSLPIMIFSVNRDCSIIYANSWLTRYTGNSVAEINTAGWEGIIHPDDYATTCMDMQRKLQEEVSFIAAELRFKEIASGEYRWHTGIFIAQLHDGVISCWNTFMVDIHAQKQIEQTLKDNQELKETQLRLEEKIKQLDQSNLQLAQFAYVASHDLQEPLRKIAFYSDLLKTKFGSQMPVDAVPFFDNLISATGRMKTLIQDVLEYSTVNKGTIASVDLNEVVKETLNDLEVNIIARNAMLDAAVLPVVKGNASQLQQLFENLVSNSIKFTAADTTPHISIWCDTTPEAHTLYFKDNGIGFDDKYQAKMFDLFQKLHTTNDYKGTGIGLAICKKIAELHGGSIYAESKPGSGATFIVKLPQ